MERAVLELANVFRTVLVGVDPFSFHAARVRRALVGGEGVHGSCLWAARWYWLLVSVSCRRQRLCGSAPRLVSTLVGGCLAGLGERDEVSSSANPGALDGQLWQLSGQRAGPAAHAWRRVEQLQY